MKYGNDQVGRDAGQGLAVGAAPYADREGAQDALSPWVQRGALEPLAPVALGQEPGTVPRSEEEELGPEGLDRSHHQHGNVVHEGGGLSPGGP